MEANCVLRELQNEFLCVQNTFHIHGYSEACHRGRPDSSPAQSVWDLWWATSHWRMSSESFGLLLSPCFHQCCHFTFFCKTSWQSLGTCFREYIYIYIYIHSFIYVKFSKGVATLSTHEVNRNRRVVCSLSLMFHLRIIEHFSVIYGIVPAD